MPLRRIILTPVFAPVYPDSGHAAAFPLPRPVLPPGAAAAQHVLHLFEQAQPGDDRPRWEIEPVRAWARNEITLTQAREAAFAANATARQTSGAAKQAALVAGQAAAVAHVAAHELGAAAYPIRAARAAALEDKRAEACRLECQRQRAQLPDAIRELLLDDQQLRNETRWFLFNC